MFTCYIIDDQKFSIEYLSGYIQKMPTLSLIGSNKNPLEAVREINEGKKPDIVFLDIEMPQLSGIATADLLPKDIIIIVTTGYAKYAINAFQINASDFLLKPYSFETFAKTVTKVISKMAGVKQLDKNNVPEQIFINAGVKGKIVQVRTLDIHFIQSKNHTITIHTKDEEFTTRTSIKEILDMLPEATFIRIHRAFVINVNAIKSIEGTQVIISGNITVPIGESYKESFISIIQKNTVRSKR